MSQYNPAKDMPRTAEQLEICAEYWAEKDPTKSVDEWKQHFISAGYGPRHEPEMPQEPELTPAQILAQKRAAIDAETSAAIMAGFDYAINGVTYRIHYDRDDQLNFESAATGCLMKKSGVEGLPDTAPVNAYRPDGSMVRFNLPVDEFLALYGATLAHKKACLDAGSAKKAALEA